MAFSAARTSKVIFISLTCCLWVGVLAANVYRAARQPITHDEAFTYRFYVASPWYYLVDHFDANNHLVNSIGCRITTALFGVSELSMRLPCLIGGAFYMLLVFRLCRYVFGSGPFLLIAVSLLVLNPLVLDFLSIARGYGIAMAFMLAGMDQLFRYIEEFNRASPSDDGRKRLTWAAVCFALSLHSNLTFLIGAGSIAMVFLGVAIYHGRRTLDSASCARLILSLKRDFIRPGLWVFGVLAITLVKMRPRHFYFGEDTLTASLRGIGQASLNHHPIVWPWNTESPAFQTYINVISTWGPALVLLAVLLVGLPPAVRWLRGRKDFHSLDRHDRFLLFSGASLLLACTILFGFHIVLGLRYPHERTGLYLIPLFTLGFLSVLYGMLHRGKIRRLLGVPGLVLSVVLISQYAAQFPGTYYREWKYDSTSRDVFQFLAEYGNRSPNGRTRVACHFFFFPSLYFYCAANHVTCLELMDTRYDQRPGDVYVYNDIFTPSQTGLVPIFNRDSSGVIISAVEQDGEPIAARPSFAR